MSLNSTIYFPNPLKSRTYGLSDTVRADNYAYTAVYTVSGAETLQIKEGIFTIYGTNSSGVTNQATVILDINGKEIVLACINNMLNGAIINTTVTLGQLGLNNIVLATGDPIKIKFVYPNALASYVASIKATLIVEDFTA